MGNENQKQHEEQSVHSIHQEGLLAYQAGQYEIAVRKFTEAIVLDPTNKDYRLERRVCLEKLGRLDDAVREYDRVLELFPDCGTAWTYKARVLLTGLRSFEEAVVCADNALQLNRKDVLAWDAKGYAFEMQQKIDEAMACYEELIQLSPAEGYMKKGQLLLYEYCDIENANTCFEKALDLGGRNVIALNFKGIISCCLGLFEEAIKYYDNAIDVSPNDPYVWRDKGIALMYQGNLQEAEKCFQRAATYHPAASLNSLGYLCLYQGRFQEALIWFEKVFVTEQIEKKKQLAAQGKTLCEYLMASPRPPTCPEPTKESLQKLNKLNKIEMYFCRGRTLLIYGELEQAKKAFEKCLEWIPNYKAAAIEIDKIKQLVSDPMAISVLQQQNAK